MNITLALAAVLLFPAKYVSTSPSTVSDRDIQLSTLERPNNLLNRSTTSKASLLLKQENKGFRNEHKCADEFVFNFESNKRKFHSTKFGNKGRKLCNNTLANINFKYFEFKERLILTTAEKQSLPEEDRFRLHSNDQMKLTRNLTSTDKTEVDANPDGDVNNRLIITDNKGVWKRETEDYYDQNKTNQNGSDLTGNETEEEFLERIRNYIFPRTWTWVLIILHSAVFVIGLVGNTLVCVAVYRNHTMRTVTNYFIVNLAVADFLVILLCLPPSVIWDVTMTWFLGVALCKIVLYLQTVSVTVSVLTLTFISVDRWYAICFPLKFKSTTGRAKTAIGIIWLLALIFDIPELVVYRTVPYEKFQYETIYFTQCEPSWSVDADRTWIVLKMILLYAIPLIFMTVAYCQIIRVLWKSGNVHQHSLDVSGGRHVNTFTMNTNTSTEGQLRSRRKAAKMLVAVVIMFAVCYFPVHLLSVLRVTVSMLNSDSNRACFLISHWLCYANSAVNPIIYNFMSGKFRKEFRRAFEHCCQPSSNNQRGYQLSNMYPKNTERDSGIGSRSHSRSSKKTLTEVRRLGTIEKGFTENHTTRRQSEKTIVSKIEV